MSYVYILDYESDTIWQVELKDIDFETYNCEQVEQILINKGFNIDKINYIVTEFEQELIKIK